MGESSLTRFVLPAILFPALTVLAGKYIFANLTNTSFGAEIGAACAPGLSFARPYTGHEEFDKFMCRLVAFFDFSLKPESEALTTDLVAELLPIALFTFVEAARSGRPLVLSSLVAALVGVAYQRFTGGAILPLYWTVFILTGSHVRRGTVDLRHARALSLATLAGYVFPSVMMIGTRTPDWIALWQGFPVLLFLAERAFLLLSPIASSTKSGTQVVRVLYVFAAVVAAVVHLSVVLPNIGDVDALKQIFVPHVVPTQFERTTGPKGALNTLQWDGIFIAGAAQIASLWFGRSFKEVLGLLLWNVVGGAVIGPGSALAIVYAWREGFIGA